MKNYYQEFKNLGLNDEQIEGLMVFAQGQMAEEVYRQAVGAFSTEELGELEKKKSTQINTDKRQIGTDAIEVRSGMRLVEKAYFEKTGRTMKELADGILNDYLERFLRMIKDLHVGMEKVVQSPAEQLEELKKALEKRDVGKVKEILRY